MPKPRPVALVTGAAKRVGRAIAVQLARSGHDIVLHFRNSKTEAQETAKSIEQHGARAWLVQGDFSEPSTASRIVAEAVEKAGGVDVLLNNAAVFEQMPLANFDARAWHECMQINLAAPIQMCQHIAPVMQARGGGCIVNLCDICTSRPWKDQLSYGPSKAGLDYITRALARELAPSVRVNGVAPGIAAFPDSYPQALRDKLITQVPLARAGTPEDIAQAVQFLVDSEYITGQIIAIDGGRSIA